MITSCPPSCHLDEPVRLVLAEETERRAASLATLIGGGRGGAAKGASSGSAADSGDLQQMLAGLAAGGGAKTAGGATECPFKLQSLELGCAVQRDLHRVAAVSLSGRTAKTVRQPVPFLAHQCSARWLPIDSAELPRSVGADEMP